MRYVCVFVCVFLSFYIGLCALSLFNSRSIYKCLHWNAFKAHLICIVVANPFRNSYTSVCTMACAMFGWCVSALEEKCSAMVFVCNRPSSPWVFTLNATHHWTCTAQWMCHIHFIWQQIALCTTYTCMWWVSISWNASFVIGTMWLHLNRIRIKTTTPPAAAAAAAAEEALSS